MYRKFVTLIRSQKEIGLVIRKVGSNWAVLCSNSDVKSAVLKCRFQSGDKRVQDRDCLGLTHDWKNNRI